MTITVFWQPGCTSCLRTKEFLRTHGIEFESVNVRDDQQAMARLAGLGARSVPLVARGDAGEARARADEPPGQPVAPPVRIQDDGEEPAHDVRRGERP